MSVTTLGNYRNGSVGDHELNWMWSLARRQAELEHQWKQRDWVQESVNADVWWKIRTFLWLIKQKEKQRSMGVIVVDDEGYSFTIRDRKGLLLAFSR